MCDVCVRHIAFHLQEMAASGVPVQTDEDVEFWSASLMSLCATMESDDGALFDKLSARGVVKNAQDFVVVLSRDVTDEACVELMTDALLATWTPRDCERVVRLAVLMDRAGVVTKLWPRLTDTQQNDVRWSTAFSRRPKIADALGICLEDATEALPTQSSEPVSIVGEASAVAEVAPATVAAASEASDADALAMESAETVA